MASVGKLSGQGSEEALTNQPSQTDREEEPQDDADEYDDDEDIGDDTKSRERGSVSKKRSDFGDEDDEEDVRPAEGIKSDEHPPVEAKPKKKDLTGYKIRPDLEDKFRPGFVQILIEKVIRDHLDGQIYDAEIMPNLVKTMTQEVHQKVKSQNYKRYKIVTYMSLGERRGEGVSSATRCIWDAESDCMATFTFLNETIFCCATVYGVYFY